MNFRLLAGSCDRFAPANEHQAFCSLRFHKGTLYSVYKERQVLMLLLLILHMVQSVEAVCSDCQ